MTAPILLARARLQLARHVVGRGRKGCPFGAHASLRPHVAFSSAAELMRKEIPFVRWVVHQILPEGVTLLHGKPKLGAKFAPFYADLRAAALLMSVGDLIELIGWERLGKRGAEAAPKQEDALDPWLGRKTDGDDQASHGTARGGR